MGLWRVNTSMKEDMIDHVTLGLGVIETERTAQFPQSIIRGGTMSGFHMQGKGGPAGQTPNKY